MDLAYVRRTFLELVQIGSHSLCEHAIATRCRRELESLGFRVHEDGAGRELSGESGNLIATLEGDPERTPIVLAAHMDTVEPGIGVRPRVDENGVVYSDGTTVLGADDKSGITAIFAAVHDIVNSGVSHGTIQVILTVAEELGLLGAKLLSREDIKGNIGLCVDSSFPVGCIVVGGPSQVRWQAEVYGRTAHAGVAPERGISAIKVAAEAVSKMPHGRLDEETTVNVGSFVGQGPSNIVAERAVLVGEARSRNQEKLDTVVEQIHHSFDTAAKKAGASVQFSSKVLYHGFHFEENAPVRARAESALRQVGFTPRPTLSGGGSDANVLTALGVPTMNLGIGYQDNHATTEHVSLHDILAAAQVVRVFCELPD